MRAMQFNQMCQFVNTHPAQFAHAGDTGDDGQEDDGGDDHLHQLDETVADRLHRLAGPRREVTQQHAQHARAPGHGGRFEQHVDRRPREPRLYCSEGWESIDGRVLHNNTRTANCTSHPQVSLQYSSYTPTITI